MIASSLARVQNYIGAVRPPTYPFAVDQAAAQQGRAIFDGCVCRVPRARRVRTGTVIPIAEIGTDRHRLDAWTANDANAFNALGDGRDWKFSAFRKTDGYVAVPLDGVWLRAPYLHNGSVPSLADLLEPPERRPRAVLARIRRVRSREGRIRVVGIGGAADRDSARRHRSRATAMPATCIGTELPAESKRVLLEFLKTQ